MQHDDTLGDAVCLEEMELVQGTVMENMLGRGPAGRPYFPGSQPVSLARSNLNLLKEHRYWVSAVALFYRCAGLHGGTCLNCGPLHISGERLCACTAAGVARPAPGPMRSWSRGEFHAMSHLTWYGV